MESSNLIKLSLDTLYWSVSAWEIWKKLHYGLHVSIRGRIIPKTIKQVFVASPLSTQHQGVRAKDWLSWNQNNVSEWGTCLSHQSKQCIQNFTVVQLDDFGIRAQNSCSKVEGSLHLFVNRNLNLGLHTSYKIHSECLNLFLNITSVA